MHRLCLCCVMEIYTYIVIYTHTYYIPKKIVDTAVQENQSLLFVYFSSSYRVLSLNSRLSMGGGIYFHDTSKISERPLNSRIIM